MNAYAGHSTFCTEYYIDGWILNLQVSRVSVESPKHFNHLQWYSHYFSNCRIVLAFRVYLFSIIQARANVLSHPKLKVKKNPACFISGKSLIPRGCELRSFRMEIKAFILNIYAEIPFRTSRDQNFFLGLRTWAQSANPST